MNDDRYPTLLEHDGKQFIAQKAYAPDWSSVEVVAIEVTLAAIDLWLSRIALAALLKPTRDVDELRFIDDSAEFYQEEIVDEQDGPEPPPIDDDGTGPPLWSAGPARMDSVYQVVDSAGVNWIGNLKHSNPSQDAESPRLSVDELYAVRLKLKGATP